MTDPYAPDDNRPVRDPRADWIEVDGVLIPPESYYADREIVGAWKRRMAENFARIKSNLEQIERNKRK
jgi:hypothetical protein